MATVGKYGDIILSTGTTVEGTIGASEELKIYSGYDNSIYVCCESGNFTNYVTAETISPKEAVELAEFMILRWIAVRDKWKGE